MGTIAAVGIITMRRNKGLNKMRKCLALLLALTLVLLAGCSNAQRSPSSSAAGSENYAVDGGPGQGDPPAKSLLEHGQELISLMGEMAGTGAYIGLYTENTEIGGVLSAAGEGDFSNPKAVYRVQISEVTLSRLLEQLGIASLDGLTPELRESLKTRSVSSLPTLINSMGGANTLAAASICTANKTFRSTEVPGNGMIYLYFYENAVPAAVVFLPGEDGTASATGMLILYDGFQAEDPDDLSGLLGELGADIWEIF